MTRHGGAPKDGADGEEEVKLLVANLKQVLGIKLDGGVARKMEDALDAAAVLSEDLQGKAAAGEIVEDTSVNAGDVHSAAEAGEVDIHCRFFAVAAEEDGVGLHIVLEILAL